MGWDQAEVEGEAVALLRSAGFTPDDEPSMVAVAEGLGAEVVPGHARSMPGTAALCRVRDAWRIYVRQRVPAPRLRGAVAHEVAELWLRLRRYTGADIEHAADRLGAAVLAPRQRVLELARRERRFPRLAAALRAPEPLVVLRVAEVTGAPTALVSPSSVRVRGDDWGWPSEAELRWLARPEAVPPRGLRRLRLRDDLERVALLAA